MMKVLFISLIFSVTCIIVKAQIPVTDVAMNTNSAINQVVNASTWGEQLLNLKQQSSVLVTTLKYVNEVSSAVREAAYAKSLIERQNAIVKKCSQLVKNAKKVNLSYANSISNSLTSLLATNSSLTSLITSTLTTKFKMNDSDRLSSMMAIKKEQQELINSLNTTSMIISTTKSCNDIVNLQLFK